MVNFFKTKYPIIAAPMNQVSTVDLAVACFAAGILPSLSLYTYKLREFYLDHKIIDTVVKKFQDRTGSSNLLLSVSRGDFLQQSFFDLVIENNIQFLELIPNDISYPVPEQPELYKQYIERDVVPLPKCLSSSFVPLKYSKGIIFKGKDGAGRADQSVDAITEVKTIREKFPDLSIVMSGGIGCSEDVKTYLNLGCVAVGIGTLLAASEESCLSYETKLKMVQSNWNNVRQLNDNAHQNALVFSKVDNDDFNHTESLKLGIKDPSRGLVFAGKGINHIKSIMPIKDIVQSLVEGL